MQHDPNPWRRPEAAEVFLNDIRAAIPMAVEQIDVLLRIVHHALGDVGRLLDLGCGDGILGRTVLANYPKGSGVFVDFSEHMIAAAKQRADVRRATFAVADLATGAWRQSLEPGDRFDLVVSGLAIHHLPDERKQALYAEIFDLLKPGGMFLNLEHVAQLAAWATEAHDDLFIDSLWSHDHAAGGEKSRDAIAAEWRNRIGEASDLPATLDVQCRWLKEIGFVEVDCFFKVFAFALFGGRKPAGAANGPM
jgi:tRNA (cmo5U34)-methyltransferase